MSQAEAAQQALADKYAAAIEENRRLYNQVQDLKGNIRVFCRVRPLAVDNLATEAVGNRPLIQFPPTAGTTHRSQLSPEAAWGF